MPVWLKQAYLTALIYLKIFCMKKKLTAPALLVTMLTIAPFAIQNGVADDKAQTEAEIKALELEIQQMNKTLTSLNKQRTSTQTRIQNTDKDISQLHKEIGSLEAKLKEGQGEVKKLQRRQNNLAAQTEEQKKQIAHSLKSMYLSSNDSRLKLLLNQEDPEEISRQLSYLEYVQKAQLSAVQAFEDSLRELNEVEQQQQTLVTRLSTEKVELDKKKKVLERRQTDRKTLLAKLNKKRQTSNRELSQMERQHQKLEEVLATIISRQVVNSTPFNRLKGSMPRPLMGKVLYKYNQQRPDTRLSWPGIFITNTAGTPVKAVHDGRVIFSDWMRGYGLLTIVDHGDDYLTLYAHTQTVLKKEGEVVLAGEPLAISGQSGGQLNSGVYFEVRKKGNPMNPEIWLRNK